MKQPTIAVVSFPGNNCEFESLRAIARSGMRPLYFRWNDDRAKLADVDGYFLVGGFSYEDRGRSGMVAARDGLMDFIGREAEAGKVVIGNCNGAQVLVESGLIPLDSGLRMSLARNVVEAHGAHVAPGFLSQWVWITPASGKDRCATSNWDGVIHLPIAHGEGRFVTRDKDVMAELTKNKQVAFAYCDAQGNVSMDPAVTPNGAMFSAAGICNPAGNVVALMPHPERTPNGTPYFDALRMWIETKGRSAKAVRGSAQGSASIPALEPGGVELFIDAIITNNEERTVEQTARAFAASITVKQWKYYRASRENIQGLLADLSVFNANKERAFIREKDRIVRWDGRGKREEPLDASQAARVFAGTKLLRRDLPDTSAESLGSDAITGVCYGIGGVEAAALSSRPLLEVFGNPHASELYVLA